jgi:predicted AlkP superfamily phosphohydrolase/phosphomutase
MRPSLHTFFGISHLLERVPNFGLWEVRSTGSLDRESKAIWEVASDFARRVVVVNTISSRPVQPVNGRMVVYQGVGGPSTAFPANLAEEWRVYSTKAGARPLEWRKLRSEPFRLIDKASVETGFALEVFSQEEFDLGVYFTSLVDVTSHLTWDFHSPNKRLITSSPDSLNNAEWEQLVLRHAQAPVFAAYRELDRTVGEFVERYQANFLVVSDHGWTYSGFEHYGSQNGIVILSGPDFEPGVNLKEARIEDIAPTVVSLLGIPMSRELIGQPLGSATFIAQHSEYVASYGVPKRPRKDNRPAIDNEELQRLKNLGYIQ